MGGTFWSLMDEEWGYEGIRNMEEKREEKGCGMKVSCVFRDSCPVIFFFFLMGMPSYLLMCSF